MIFEFDHEFPLPREEHEYGFACEEHERAIDRAHGHGGRQIVSWTDNGHAFHRVFLYRPEVAIPSWLARLIGREVGRSTQTMWYDRSTHAGGYDIATDPLGDRFVYRSRFEIVPRGPHSSARVSRLELDVKLPLPGIRGMVERRIAGEIQSRAPLELEATRRFYAETWPRIRTEVMSRWPQQVILANSGSVEPLDLPVARAG